MADDRDDMALIIAEEGEDIAELQITQEKLAGSCIVLKLTHTLSV